MAIGRPQFISALAALAAAAIWYTPATAELSAALPNFKACTPATAPDLPARWHAVGLMMPFQQGQLDVAEFEYDGAIPAMRATIYGLKSGAADILITEKSTYLLIGPHRSPKRCISLGPKLRPPSAQWLSSSSVCVGEAPLAAQTVQWWQKPGFDVARYWFTTDSRLPWRSLFTRRSLDPAVIGDYAMTHFPKFTSVATTSIAALQKLCNATSKSNTQDLAATPTARELMAIRNDDAEAERDERIGELIPGLSHKPCADMTPAQWPDHFVTTAIVTPISINDAPYSTLIYYDWSGARTLLILPFHGAAPTLQGILSLKYRVGYSLKFSDPAKRVGVCRANMPGAVRPDWMKAASCECQGVLKRNTMLSQNAESQILSCPIKGQGSRIMWSWYTTQGRPNMFMEAAPEGSGGVMLADYDDWLPDQTGAASDFELPNACAALDNSGGAGHSSPTFSNDSCSDCHTTFK